MRLPAAQATTTGRRQSKLLSPASTSTTRQILPVYEERASSLASKPRKDAHGRKARSKRLLVVTKSPHGSCAKIFLTSLRHLRSSSQETISRGYAPSTRPFGADLT